jgi:tetratricopeptide (TPR) repeat protein
VWSLGVTLFQMLTGRLPLDLTGRTLPQAARMLQDDEPTRVDTLVPSLRGDVATIVHKALAKEPQRRYAAAGELAADMRRHLRSEPIAARPSSALYQFSRFARRHRALVFGLVATILALVAGLAVSLRFLAGEREQRGIAERRAGDVRALARDLIFDVEGQLAKVAGATDVRRHVVATGLRYTEGLLKDAGNDPKLLTDVGLAFQKLAGVLGDPSRPNLGDIPAAEATLQKAIAALERAAALAAAPGDALEGLLGARNMEAELHRSQNRAPQRLAALQQARDVAGRLAAIDDKEGADLAYAAAAANLGRLQFDTGEFELAIRNFEIYLASQKERIGTHDSVAPRNAALILGFIADSKRNIGDTGGCREALEEGLAIAEAFHREHPDDASARRSVVAALRGLAMDETLAKRHAGALPLLERASTMLAAAAPDPKDISLLRERAVVDYDFASALIDLDRAGEAVDRVVAYQQQVAALLQKSPENRNRVRDVMLGHQLAARLHGRTGDEQAMAASFAAALEQCEKAVAADGAGALPWEDLAKTQRVGALASADLAKAATGEVKARLQQRVRDGLEAESATLAKMGEHGFRQAWIPTRQQAIADALEALRAGREVESGKE